MKQRVSLAVIAGFVLLIAGCSTDRAVDPPLASGGDGPQTLTADTERIAHEIIASSDWAYDPDLDLPAKAERSGGAGALPCVLFGEREQIAGDIYHYSWDVRVDTGPFDVIKLHRVVRESAPYRPIRSRKSVFMLHGDFKTFDGCFLPGLLVRILPRRFRHRRPYCPG